MIPGKLIKGAWDRHRRKSMERHKKAAACKPSTRDLGLPTFTTIGKYISMCLWHFVMAALESQCRER